MQELISQSDIQNAIQKISQFIDKEQTEATQNFNSSNLNKPEQIIGSFGYLNDQSQTKNMTGDETKVIENIQKLALQFPEICDQNNDKEEKINHLFAVQSNGQSTTAQCYDQKCFANYCSVGQQQQVKQVVERLYDHWIIKHKVLQEKMQQNQEEIEQEQLKQVRQQYKNIKSDKIVKKMKEIGTYQPIYLRSQQKAQKVFVDQYYKGLKEQQQNSKLNQNASNNFYFDENKNDQQAVNQLSNSDNTKQLQKSESAYKNFCQFYYQQDQWQHAKYQKRMQLFTQQQSDILQNLTFTPKINDKSIKIINQKPNQSVVDRLYSQASEKSLKINKIQSELLEKMPFKPHINEHSKNLIKKAQSQTTFLTEQKAFSSTQHQLLKHFKDNRKKNQYLKRGTTNNKQDQISKSFITEKYQTNQSYIKEEDNDGSRDFSEERNKRLEKQQYHSTSPIKWKQEQNNKQISNKQIFSQEKKCQQENNSQPISITKNSSNQLKTNQTNLQEIDYSPNLRYILDLLKEKIKDKSPN